MERTEKILGVEGGGTKTAWVLVERTEAGGADLGSQLRILDSVASPPCNRGATSSADHYSVAMSEGSCKAGFAITASDDSGVWPDFGAEP